MINFNNGWIYILIFKDATPNTLRTYFESDSIQEWNKAFKEENLFAERWEESPPFYEEFVHK